MTQRSTGVKTTTVGWKAHSLALGCNGVTITQMPEMQGAINPYALPDAWEDEHFADMVRAGLELGDAECDQIAHTQLLVHMRTGLKLRM